MKSKVRIPVSKGKLYGYHTADLAKDRRSLLKKLIKTKVSTYSQIIKRLNVLAIYNKNRHPDTSDKIRRDIRHLQIHMANYKKKRPSKKQSFKRIVSKKRSRCKKGYRKSRVNRKCYKKSPSKKTVSKKRPTK